MTTKEQIICTAEMHSNECSRLDHSKKLRSSGNYAELPTLAWGGKLHLGNSPNYIVISSQGCYKERKRLLAMHTHLEERNQLHNV
jgi:hypothetical protein